MKRRSEILEQRDLITGEIRKAESVQGEFSKEVWGQIAKANELETNYDRKKAYILRGNVESFIKTYGLANCGFMTVTFPDNVTDPREAQRRFNNWYSNIVRKQGLIQDYVIVMEPQKRGACHYHLLVNCGRDIRTGFDFKSFEGAMTLRSQRKWRTKEYRDLTKAYGRSASEYLSFLWVSLRNRNRSYGIGQVNLAPLKSNSEAVSHYVSKYITKTLCLQGEQFKGARLVRYSQGFWRTHRNGFTWNSESSTEWREKVSKVAKALGVSDYDQLADRLGPKWAYWVMYYSDLGCEPEEIASYIVLERIRRTKIKEGEPLKIERLKKDREEMPEMWAIGYVPRDLVNVSVSEAMEIYDRESLDIVSLRTVEALEHSRGDPF